MAGASSESDVVGGVALGERIERGQELGAVVDHESGTVLEVSAGGGERIGHIGKGEVVVGEEVRRGAFGPGRARPPRSWPTGARATLREAGAKRLRRGRLVPRDERELLRG
jgi:hypothetical protein